MSDSEIVLNKDGSLASLNGRDAVRLMQIQTVKQGIDMYIKTNGRMILTRGATITRLLDMAGALTKKKYKRTEKQQAVDDLKILFDTLMLSLPTRTIG